jgi:hypothetical protein
VTKAAADRPLPENALPEAPRVGQPLPENALPEAPRVGQPLPENALPEAPREAHAAGRPEHRPDSFLSNYPPWFTYAAGTAENLGVLLLPRLVWLSALALAVLSQGASWPAHADPDAAPSAACVDATPNAAPVATTAGAPL